MSFEKFDLAQTILRAVTAEGFVNPTPIQAESIPHVMAGKDLLGCAQTGTGKTAAFALPILHRLLAEKPQPGQGRKIRVLVLAPTRELAAQIYESFRKFGKFTPLRYTVVYGGVGQFPQVKALRNGVDVLVATPGRLCDLMNQGHIDITKVEQFVLDEADRMLDMGFLPDLKRILEKLPKKRQTVFFSATMPPTIESLANACLKNPTRIIIEPKQATTDQIDESICFVSQAQKAGLLTEMLQVHKVTRALVFTRTKHGADRVARQLERAGIPAEAMHGNKSQSARQRTLANFKSNRPPVVVATDLAARGIDVTAVSHVFNYDLPQEPETYVHRIGRTGRAGMSGMAVSFCSGEERGIHRAIEKLLKRKIRIEKTGGYKSITNPPAPEAGGYDSPERLEDKPQDGESGGYRGGGYGGRSGGSRAGASGGRPKYKTKQAKKPATGWFGSSAKGGSTSSAKPYKAKAASGSASGGNASGGHVSGGHSSTTSYAGQGNRKKPKRRAVATTQF